MRKILILFLFFSQVLVSLAQTTYLGHIKPILSLHCMPCHESKNIGPIVLNNYNSVKSYSNMIHEVVSKKIMPPYQVNLSECNESIMQNSLSPQEINTLGQWIRDGHLLGEENLDVKNEQTESTSLDSMVFSLTSKFELLPSEDDHTQIFVIPNSNNEAIYVKKIQFVPGVKTAMKSAIVHIDISGRSNELEKTDRRYGYANYSGPAFVPSEFSWYGWNPFYPTQLMQNGFTKMIPAQSNVLLQITYKVSNKPIIDSTSKLVVWYSRSIDSDKVVSSNFIIDTAHLTIKPFIIKKHQQKIVSAERAVHEDMLIHAISPQGQIVLQAYKIYVVNEKGEQKPLLSIHTWDSHMKTKYHFAKPITIKKGSKIVVEANYNFTEENTTLPIIPLGRIQYGNGSKDELFLISFDTSVISNNQ